MHFFCIFILSTVHFNASFVAILWHHRMGTPVLASVAVSGNRLFAVDYGGFVYAFDLKGK
uniref:PQQ-binding-like beta-propeller repeat protein n=1 Tax=Parabacteroides massiliensis TaxID=1750560 RepID=UPI00096A9111